MLLMFIVVSIFIIVITTNIADFSVVLLIVIVIVIVALFKVVSFNFVHLASSTRTHQQLFNLIRKLFLPQYLRFSWHIWLTYHCTNLPGQRVHYIYAFIFVQSDCGASFNDLYFIFLRNILRRSTYHSSPTSFVINTIHTTINQSF